MMNRLTLAAALGLIAIAAVSQPASARWWGDGRWHEDNRWSNNNDRYYGYYYQAPPVVWGTPYNYGYYAPPVYYDSSPGITFTIRP